MNKQQIMVYCCWQNVHSHLARPNAKSDRVIMHATVSLRLCLRDHTNNTDIGWQDRIVLNIAKLDAY